MPPLANYSLTPYAFSLTPKYARGGERRPIDDIDGKGASLRDHIEVELSALISDSLQINPIDNTKSIRVTRFDQYAEFSYLELGVGRAGVVGNIHQRSGGRISYDDDEHNETFIRAIFVYPSGSHEAYWLSERAGQTSAFSSLGEILVRALRNKFQDLTINLDPVAEWSAVKAWADQVSVQEIRFDAPRPGGSTQAIDVNGIHADVRIVIKPKGSLTLSKLVRDDGPDRQAVFGFLSGAPLISESAVTTDHVIGTGWKAQVAFKTRGGRQRSFGLALDESAPSLIYPVGVVGKGSAGARRPTNVQFAAACAEFLEDVEGRLPVGTSVAAEILNRLT